MLPSLMVHGGAGLFRDAPQAECREGAAEALRAGKALLDEGRSALDAVEAAVRVLEDLPCFNAGTGSVLNAQGEVEMDAAVMTGEWKVGGVAAVRRIRNPISLARQVMEASPHVLLAAEGAERFALSRGLALCDPAALITAAQRARFLRAQGGGAQGTVGAVACDVHGKVAAATSTGGIALKLPGRVGDSPIPGAGLYAEDSVGAASATGQGEAILKMALCRRAVDLLRQGLSPAQASARAVEELFRRTGGRAGLIVIATSGEIGCAFNTEHMARACFDASGSVVATL